LDFYTDEEKRRGGGQDQNSMFAVRFLNTRRPSGTKGKGEKKKGEKKETEARPSPTA